ERLGQNRVSFLNQNPVRVFPCGARTNVQRPALNVQHRTSEKLLCGDEIFCHLSSTWTADSRSTVRFCSSISFSLSPSAFTWAGRRKISKISHWVAEEFSGGLCSLR